MQKFIEELTRCAQNKYLCFEVGSRPDAVVMLLTGMKWFWSFQSSIFINHENFYNHFNRGYIASL